MTRTVATETAARVAAYALGHRLGNFASDPALPGARDAFCTACGRHVEYRVGLSAPQGQALLTRCPVPSEGAR